MTWVFFRAKSFGKAWLVLNGMFGFNAKAEPILPIVHLVCVGAIVGGIVLAHWLMRERTLESAVARAPAPVRVGGLGADGVRDRDRAGNRQCLHLFPVLTASAARMAARSFRCG